MGYRIVYSPQMDKKYPVAKQNVKYQRWIITTACVILVIFAIAKLDKTGKVKEFLMPGDPEFNKQAITTFVEDVRSGEPVLEAASAFCEQILKNAQES